MDLWGPGAGGENEAGAGDGLLRLGGGVEEGDGGEGAGGGSGEGDGFAGMVEVDVLAGETDFEEEGAEKEGVAREEISVS